MLITLNTHSSPLTVPVAAMFPVTESFSDGSVSPIPTFPSVFIVRRVFVEMFWSSEIFKYPVVPWYPIDHLVVFSESARLMLA